MTPADELLALAGKATPGEWEAVEHSWSDTSIVAATHTVARMSISDEATEENQYELQARESANAAFIAAACNFVRSDAFRAMVRNDARYRWLRDDAPTGTGEMASVRDHHTPAEMDAAIDAAASGAGESDA